MNIFNIRNNRSAVQKKNNYHSDTLDNYFPDWIPNPDPVYTTSPKFGHIQTIVSKLWTGSVQYVCKTSSKFTFPLAHTDKILNQV